MSTELGKCLQPTTLIQAPKNSVIKVRIQAKTPLYSFAHQVCLQLLDASLLAGEEKHLCLEAPPQNRTYAIAMDRPLQFAFSTYQQDIYVPDL